jgi:hypothetical protein
MDILMLVETDTYVCVSKVLEVNLDDGRVVICAATSTPFGRQS